MITGRTFRALFGFLIIVGDGYIVFTQIKASIHFELNDLIFHIVVFVGGLLLIDFRVGKGVMTGVSDNIKKRFSGRFKSR